MADIWVAQDQVVSIWGDTSGQDSWAYQDKGELIAYQDEGDSIAADVTPGASVGDA